MWLCVLLLLLLFKPSSSQARELRLHSKVAFKKSSVQSDPNNLCYLNITGMFSFSFLKSKIMFSRLDFLCMFLVESFAFEISDWRWALLFFIEWFEILLVSGCFLLKMDKVRICGYVFCCCYCYLSHHHHKPESCVFTAK